MQGRQHRPTKNAIRIALFASSTILAPAWAIQLHLGIEGVKSQFTIFKTMKTAPRKPQYGRWSCLWSSGCDARQARPTHQKRNTYYTFCFFENIGSCMSSWIVHWPGGCKNQFSLIKTMKTAPQKPQYERWSCLWSWGAFARQARPPNQKRKHQ